MHRSAKAPSKAAPISYVHHSKGCAVWPDCTAQGTQQQLLYETSTGKSYKRKRSWQKGCKGCLCSSPAPSLLYPPPPCLSIIALGAPPPLLNGPVLPHPSPIQCAPSTSLIPSLPHSSLTQAAGPHWCNETQEKSLCAAHIQSQKKVS